IQKPGDLLPVVATPDPAGMRSQRRPAADRFVAPSAARRSLHPARLPSTSRLRGGTRDKETGRWKREDAWVGSARGWWRRPWDATRTRRPRDWSTPAAATRAGVTPETVEILAPMAVRAAPAAAALPRVPIPGPTSSVPMQGAT